MPASDRVLPGIDGSASTALVWSRVAVGRCGEGGAWGAGKVIRNGLEDDLSM